MAKPASAEQKAATAEQRRVEQPSSETSGASEAEPRGALVPPRRLRAASAGAIFSAFSGISLLAALRSAFPRVLFQRPRVVQGGLSDRLRYRRGERRSSRRTSAWDHPRTRRASTRSSPSARTSAARRAGCGREQIQVPLPRQRLLQDGASTSKARRRVRSSACASPRPKTASSVIDKAVKYLYEKGDWKSPAPS